MPKNIDLLIEFKLPSNIKEAKASIRPNGDFILLDKNGDKLTPEHMTRTVQYKRPKKPKVQNKISFESQITSIAGLQELTKYESIFITDTNTKMIGGNKISACCFICCKLHEESDKYRVECESRLNVYELHNVVDNPELLAILKIANDVTNSEGFSNNQRFAIVTDTELDSHASFNKKHKLIYSNQYLPIGFELLYASSDTGREFLNRLIRFCEKQSEKYLADFEDNTLPERKYKKLKEDESVQYCYSFKDDLEIVNPVIKSLRIPEGTKVALYGKR